MTKVRDSYFDNAKFFLILLVVFGHSLTKLKSDMPIINALYTFIFIFHMPAFILISGYFSKHFKKQGYVSNVVKKTLIPYIIFQVIYSYFYYMTGYEHSFKIDLVSPHWTLWFLISILCWKLMIIPFAKLGKFGFPAAIMIGVCAGFFDSISTDYSASRTLAFFPFFYLGFLLKKEQFSELLTRKTARIASIFVLVGIYLACFYIFPQNLQDWLLHDSSYHAFDLSNRTGGFVRLFVYAITTITIFAFMALIPKKQFLFTHLGKNTLYIYLLHGFFIKTMALFPIYEKIDTLYQYTFLFAGSLALCSFLASRPVRLCTKPIIEMKIPHLQN
ncbi:acyltransferase family protein [Sporolactobacillus sp. CPB3-1]|uniref:Acyltransferase family protein n=1 Tax=Sporolactobacillus mangiferae TaxID=2940498 RepID=A0ABT0M8U1_9BACL|nr:acyltransferase family protein [Sporolactobacillus mangiferae]MCL1630760.1 acyltransferase family protein [Sporolactobacillus mangiferae]